MYTHYKHTNLKTPNVYKKKYNLDKTSMYDILILVYKKTLLLQKLFLKNHKQDLKNKTVT